MSLGGPREEHMSLWARLLGKKALAASTLGSDAEAANPRTTPRHSPVGVPNQTAPAATTNRRLRVFISSTFRDMIEERDELMTHTWPALRQLCQERHVELVEVDLRWGIAEEQSTRRGTLKLCLDEIRACRPFFIGLLGERYGWTP